MLVGCSGSPNRGYERGALAQSIDDFLFDLRSQKVVLVGVGNLGRAVLAYVSRRSPLLAVVAAFDSDPAKAGQVIMGCRCHAMTELADIVDAQAIAAGILSVPVAAAQDVAERMIAVGIRGILNFAPVTLRVPPTVYVEDIDLAMALEKVAYFARHGQHVVFNKPVAPQAPAGAGVSPLLPKGGRKGGCFEASRDAERSSRRKPPCPAPRRR
jgi:redox-sensing transcriptional repressor